VTVAQIIRRRAEVLGVSLNHIDDIELGVRLAAMPGPAIEDPAIAVTWMAFGTLDGPRDLVTASPATTTAGRRPDGAPGPDSLPEGAAT